MACGTKASSCGSKGSCKGKTGGCGCSTCMGWPETSALAGRSGLRPLDPKVGRPWFRRGTRHRWVKPVDLGSGGLGALASVAVLGAATRVGLSQKWQDLWNLVQWGYYGSMEALGTEMKAGLVDSRHYCTPRHCDSRVKFRLSFTARRLQQESCSRRETSASYDRWGGEDGKPTRIDERMPGPLTGTPSWCVGFTCNVNGAPVSGRRHPTWDAVCSGPGCDVCYSCDRRGCPKACQWALLQVMNCIASLPLWTGSPAAYNVIRQQCAASADWYASICGVFADCPPAPQVPPAIGSAPVWEIPCPQGGEGGTAVWGNQSCTATMHSEAAARAKCFEYLVDRARKKFLERQVCQKKCPSGYKPECRDVVEIITPDRFFKCKCHGYMAETTWVCTCTLEQMEARHACECRK